MVTWDASGQPDTVGVGTAGQVLTSNGAGSKPTFQDVNAVTVPVGAGTDYYGTTLPSSNWLWANGETIGKVGSGADMKMPTMKLFLTFSREAGQPWHGEFQRRRYGKTA